MTTDNRTNEPTEARVEAAAKAMHGTRNPWFAAYGDWGAAGFEIKNAFRESARAALVAAATIPKPVLDPEKVAEVIWDCVDVSPERQDFLARALCEAAKRGELSA